MRVGGIDPSSSCTGTAIADNGELIETEAWHRPKNGSDAERLMSYFFWIFAWLDRTKPDMVCVEFLSVERNAQVTRVVSHYQAVSVLACKLRGAVVIEARVTSARKATLGKGNLSKEQAWEAMKKRFPGTEMFGRKDKGGLDRMDAAVLALAGPSIAEG